jgi:hypothetical protein
MTRVAENIRGYAYDDVDVSSSPVSLEDLDRLKAAVGFTAEDERYLRLAGGVLSGQTQAIVRHWRG